ncbi:hypothetical protein [Peribacillus aracenensis]|uniref:hypothetical protein n=1 Tax=Peribacillus aracenensis TaxID=2976708 RepID=UPI0021A5C240|nr:hypothetical protein [Peribacillus sp. BBB004]
MKQLKDQVYGNQRILPFEKYLYQDDAIFDIGYGTGRTTLALYKKIPKYRRESAFYFKKKKKNPE